MPTKAKTSAKKHTATRKTRVKLNEEELNGIRQRNATANMQQERAMAETRLANMARESFEQFVETLQKKYRLPKDFQVTEDGFAQPRPPEEAKTDG